MPWKSSAKAPEAALCCPVEYDTRYLTIIPQEVIGNKGPFREVLDDDGHRMERGVRYAVCDKTYQLYKKAPYAQLFEFVDPLAEVPRENAAPFTCERTTRRDARETKGVAYRATTAASQCCDGGNCC